MSILDILSGKQSKTKVLKAIAYIGNSASKFEHFMNEFMNADTRNSQKLAWVIGTLADVNPRLLTPHIPDFIEKLEKPCHAAVKRNILRVISMQKVPQNQTGILANLCFMWLDDPNETIVVRIFSMAILQEICLSEPDLSFELIPILEYHIPHSSPGFRSRANKVIQALS